MTARHEILGGKVQLYKRDGRFWQCSASVGNQQYRATTKKEELSQAEDAAEDWYLELRGKFKRGDLGKLEEVNAEKTFAEAGGAVHPRVSHITEGQRNKQYIDGHIRRIRKYLIPFFGDQGLSKVTSGLIQEYRIKRVEDSKAAARKAPGAQYDASGVGRAAPGIEIGGQARRFIALPDMSQPYRNNSKISHRAWFSPEEYKQLYNATRERVDNPRRKKFKPDYDDLHDYVLFMVNTGLRPDESRRIEFRDVKIVNDSDSGETILEIDVRGKRGIGFCKSMPGAVHPFQRVKKRRKSAPTDLVFPKHTTSYSTSFLRSKSSNSIARGSAGPSIAYGTPTSVCA